MDEIITSFLSDLPLLVIFIIIAAGLYVLSLGANILVDDAVALSTRLGVSKAMIGATIVSLGTTTPEAAVSVMSALNGNPGLALGNAVGSIICDTGLIMGLAVLIGKVPLERTLMNRQARLQISAGFLLVIACLPFSNLSSVFDEGGRLTQVAGIIFVLLLAGYLWISAVWAKNGTGEFEAHEVKDDRSVFAMLVRLIFALALIIGSSHITIDSVEIAATRIGVPDSIIAATLVAFGTSLPELVTVVTSVRRGHGELAIGNVIGADILNVLFVAGVSAAVTKGGLTAGSHFFTQLFPAMLIMLVVLRIGIQVGKDQLPKATGYVLLACYAVYLIQNVLLLN